LEVGHVGRQRESVPNMIRRGPARQSGGPERVGSGESWF
jgi:hypothetical protein